MKKKDSLVRRRERLKFVGISLGNILPDEEEEAGNDEVDAKSKKKHKKRLIASSESEQEQEVDTPQPEVVKKYVEDDEKAAENSDTVVSCLVTSQRRLSLSDVIKRNRAVSSGDELIDDELSRKYVLFVP